jgi:hypothetical protein
MSEQTPETRPAGAATQQNRSTTADPGPAQGDLLIVDDLMLLLMDDDGASVQGAGTRYYTLGGAILTELALLGRVEVDDSVSLGGPRVTPSGEGPLPDPLLQSAYGTVAGKTQRVQTLLVTIGADLQREVVDRLMRRGLLRRQESRVLGAFRSTRFPAADVEHEAQLRARILRVLVDGADPDPRTAAIIALLYSSGSMPSLRPPLPWTSATVTRAHQIQQGHWGPEAVSTAVLRTTTAIVAASAVALSTSTADR